MSSFVERITLVSMKTGAAETLFKKKGKKRKVSRALRPAEKSTRRMINAMSKFGDEMSHRYDKSSRKRRDGWLRDGPTNVMRAQGKAAKKLFKL